MEIRVIPLSEKTVFEKRIQFVARLHDDLSYGHPLE